MFTRIAFDAPLTGLAVRLAVLLALANRPAWAGVGPPNVVLVLTDDQGYGDLAAHGNTMIRTPHLDRLHAQSVRLTDFHVDPTCSPTRAALLTGRYSTRTGVWHTIAGRSLMRSDELTLAEVLAANGYRTAIFGKWHLGDNHGLDPASQGFQDSLIHGGGGVGQTPDAWGNDYFDDTYFRNGEPTRFRGYCTDVWFDNAIRFIEDHRDRPFFIYIAPNAPHGPYRVEARYAEPYAREGVPRPMAEFYGMIENIDENVGRLVETLDRLGLSENTILIFLTDNGTAAGIARNPSPAAWPGFNAGMRGQKGSQFEGGHRVPCFVRYPAGGIDGGRDVDVLTAHIDLLPTILDLIGIECSESPRIDGVSLAPLLRDPAAAANWPDRTLFVHSQRIETPEKWRQSAVLTEQWRLVDGTALYDIGSDPGQMNDCSAEHPEVVRTLRDAYESWWESLTESLSGSVRIPIGMSDEPAWLTCHDWHPIEGEVPWNQDAIRRDPLANGVWTIDIHRPGRYRFTLRQRPIAEAHPIDAHTAQILLGGGARRTVAVSPGATSAVIDMDLAPGPETLTTRLTNADGASRGAYYVEVRRLGDSQTRAAAPRFDKQLLTDTYHCDGVNVGDFNRDGVMDIVAGPYWYEGPNYQTRHEIYPAVALEPAASPSDSLFSFVHDFSGDGWPDVLVVGRVHVHEAVWYENPADTGRAWRRHYAFPRVRGESPAFTDIDLDGRPELICHWEGRWGWIAPDWQCPTEPWEFHPVTEPRDDNQFYHGTGVGDVNGDGRPDLVLYDGWWEQPPEGAGNTPWTAHLGRLSPDRGGAQILVFDVDGDGDADLVSSLDAHGWGLAWFEQVTEPDGSRFVPHTIMGDRIQEARFGVAFTQPHALAMGDIDGDGLPDILTGKRRWAHGPEGDIEPGASPVVYGFLTRRDPKAGVWFEPVRIDDASGVGTQITATDIDRDGDVDLLTASKLGTFLFRNRCQGGER